MADLLQEIEAQIAGVKTTPAKQNVGVIREIADGVAKSKASPTRCSTRCSTRQRHHRPGAESGREPKSA